LEEAVELVVAIDGEGRSLRVRPVSLRSEGFVLTLLGPRGARREVLPPLPRTLQGEVEGMPDAAFWGALARDGIQGLLVGTGEGRSMPTLVIEPIEGLPPGGWELHARACSVELPPGFCALTTPGEWRHALDAVPLAGASGGVAGDDCPRIVQLAIDADVEFFQSLGGSVEATVAEIESIIAGVHGVYDAQLGIELVITSMVIRTAEPDPYTSKDPTVLLGQVATEWSTNQAMVTRDLVHLFTGRNLTGAPLGAAYLAGACSDLGYGLSQPLWSSALENRVAVAAHEIGHGLSATHCNNQPQCGVMCAAVGGCTLGSLEFGSFSSAQILEFVSTAPCLGPEGPALDSIGAQGDCEAILLTWEPLPGASAYTVWRAEVPGGLGDATLLATVVENAFLDQAPPLGALPQYWIGALLGDGCESERSGPVEPDGSTSIPPPAEVVASNGTCLKLTVGWSEVDGALGYQIWRGLSDDVTEAQFLAQGDTNPFKDTTAAPFITYFYWVRSVNECGSTGPFGKAVPGWRSAPPQSAASPQASDGEFCDAILLLWPLVPGASGYAVWRSTTPDPAQATQLLEVPGGFWLDQAVVEGTPYWYWVQAKSGCGASGFGAGDSGSAAKCEDGAGGGGS
jgi:hypothetical protein